MVVVLPPQGTLEPEAGLGVPSDYVLDRVVPNPSPGRSSVRFGLPQASAVTLQVYASSGALVRTLLRQERPAGYHRVVWDGRDERGFRVASGTYFWRMHAAGRRCVAVLVKTK
jgi:hypothetical protein